MTNQQIEEAFGLTTRLLFGEALTPMARYSEWLRSRLVHIKPTRCVLSGEMVPLPEYSFFGHVPKSRVVAYSKMAEVAKKMVDAPADDAPLASLLPSIRSIASFVPHFAEGTNLNVENSVAYLDCLNVQDAFDPFRTKNSAYIYQTLDSENIFGVFWALNCSAIVHGYNVLNCRRCFEVDTARNCSDSMFCHNVENIDHGLFCFNAKSLRYAIANVEVGKEKFEKVRATVANEVLANLKANGKLDYDIYNVLERPWVKH